MLQRLLEITQFCIPYFPETETDVLVGHMDTQNKYAITLLPYNYVWSCDWILANKMWGKVMCTTFVVFL